MKITDRLVGDHMTFRRMLAELDRYSGQSTADLERSRLIRTVELFKDHLLLHAWCEDTFYYPIVRGALPKVPPPLTVSYMDHLDNEHKTVDTALDLLERQVKLQPLDAIWPQTYTLFSHGLLSHMKKEEDELFPLSEQLLGSACLEEISRELESRRSEAPKVRLHTRLS